MEPEQPTTLDAAWRLLFGSESAPRGQALRQINPADIKRVFRNSARLCHPDLARAVGEDEGALTQRFQALQTAYTVILAHLEQPMVLTGSPGAGAPSSPSSGPGWESPGVSMSGAHWIGSVPDKPLRLGRFLFYTGRISREALDHALSWQRAQRPDFGALAVELGILDPLALGTLLDARRMDERIGNTAVRLGLLSPEMRDWLVSHQRRHQQPIGTFFVEQGLLTAEQLKAALAEQQRHNERARPG